MVETAETLEGAGGSLFEVDIAMSSCMPHSRDVCSGELELWWALVNKVE